MLCALTVRKLEPGTFDQFRERFMAGTPAGEPPEGWVRFEMLRRLDDPDEVICFGFFDGTADELRRSSSEQGYDEQMKAIAPFVAEVGADGLYEIVEEFAIH